MGATGATTQMRKLKGLTSGDGRLSRASKKRCRHLAVRWPIINMFGSIINIFTCPLPASPSPSPDLSPSVVYIGSLCFLFTSVRSIIH